MEIDLPEKKDIEKLEAKLDSLLLLIEEMLKTYIKPDDLMTAAQAAKKFKVVKATVLRWADEGKLEKYYPAGDHTLEPRFKAIEIEEFYKIRKQPFFTDENKGLTLKSV